MVRDVGGRVCVCVCVFAACCVCTYCVCVYLLCVCVCVYLYIFKRYAIRATRLIHVFLFVISRPTPKFTPKSTPNKHA